MIYLIYSKIRSLEVKNGSIYILCFLGKYRRIGFVDNRPSAYCSRHYWRPFDWSLYSRGLRCGPWYRLVDQRKRIVLAWPWPIIIWRNLAPPSKCFYGPRWLFYSRFFVIPTPQMRGRNLSRTRDRFNRKQVARFFASLRMTICQLSLSDFLCFQVSLL